METTAFNNRRRWYFMIEGVVAETKDGRRYRSFGSRAAAQRALDAELAKRVAP